MNESAESMQGTNRRLTPVEVGMIVRLYRHSRELKRIALAAEAHVSDKTLERLEGGIVVREDSYRRVAAAMGLPENAFIKEEYIPTPSEYLQQQEKAEAEFQKNHTKVPVARLTDPRQLLDIFGAHSSIVDDHRVTVEHLELVASFKENFRDWSDIANELPDTERLRAAMSLVDEAREIERAGYAVSVGATDRYGIGGVRTNMSVVALFPKPRGSMDPLPNAVWLPKKMRMGF